MNYFCSLLQVHVVVKTQHLVISRWCFVEYGKEMHMMSVPHEQHDYFSLFNQ